MSYLEPEYQLESKVIEEMIRECDKNGDEVIDYHEFLEMMHAPNHWDLLKYLRAYSII